MAVAAEMGRGANPGEKKRDIWIAGCFWGGSFLEEGGSRRKGEKEETVRETEREIELEGGAS